MNNRYKISIFFILIFSLYISPLYSGSIRQEHFVISNQNDDKTIDKPIYTFNFYIYLPDMFGFYFISDNRDLFNNSMHRLERRKLFSHYLTIGVNFSYFLKNAGLAYSYDPGTIKGTTIKGNYFEPGTYMRFDSFDNSFMLELYYGRRINSYSSNSSTPEKFILPANNKLNNFKASSKCAIPLTGQMDLVLLLDDSYAYAETSSKYGINSEYDQFRKINIFNPKSFIEYNEFPFLAFAGISFIYAKYNSLYLGNSYYWLDKYENNLYAVPERSVPVNLGFLNLSGFKFSNLFDTFISFQVFNSLLVCNEQKNENNINRIIDGIGGGIDFRLDFFSLINSNLAFLNGNLLLGYMSSFEFIHNKMNHIESQIFFRYYIASKW